MCQFLKSGTKIRQQPHISQHHVIRIPYEYLMQNGMLGIISQQQQGNKWSHRLNIWMNKRHFSSCHWLKKVLETAKIIKHAHNSAFISQWQYHWKKDEVVMRQFKGCILWIQTLRYSQNLFAWAAGKTWARSHFFFFFFFPGSTATSVWRFCTFAVMAKRDKTTFFFFSFWNKKSSNSCLEKNKEQWSLQARLWCHYTLVMGHQPGLLWLMKRRLLNKSGAEFANNKSGRKVST